MTRRAQLRRNESRTHGLSAETEPYLSFKVAGTDLILPLRAVSEILAYESVSALPGAPADVRGVVHVRDRTVPVIDVAGMLGRPPLIVSKRTSILMLDLTSASGSFAVGVLSDGLATLLDLDPSKIAGPPNLNGLPLPYVRGLYAQGSTSLTLIDFAVLLEGTAPLHWAKSAT